MIALPDRCSVARVVLVALVAFLGMGCSRDGAVQHVPSLWFDEAASRLVPQGEPVFAYAQFSDDGADVSTGRVVVMDASGAVLLDDVGPIEGAAGESSGTIEFAFENVGAPCGVYTLQIWLGDAAGSWSAPATMELRLVAGFDPPVSYPLPMPSGSGWVALGDLDGDGRLDVVMADAEGSSVAAWLQTPDGALAAPVVAELGGVRSSAVAAGDVDGDGMAEIVVVAEFPPEPLETTARLVVLKRSAGGLSVVTAVSLGDSGGAPTPLALADLDRDGDLDVVTVRGNPSVAQLVLMFQEGGSLGAPVPLEVPVMRGSPDASVTLAAADLDGDAATDLVIPRPGGGIAVLRQTSPGSFAAPEPYDLGGNGPSITAGDVDGDGLADALVFGAAGAKVLLGRAAGPFAPVDAGAGGILADLDGDGLAEAVGFDGTAVITSYTADGVLLGRGFGFFVPTSHYEASALGAWAVGDVTGDGEPDLVVAHLGMLHVLAHR